MKRLLIAATIGYLALPLSAQAQAMPAINTLDTCQKADDAWEQGIKQRLSEKDLLPYGRHGYSLCLKERGELHATTREAADGLVFLLWQTDQYKELIELAPKALAAETKAASKASKFALDIRLRLAQAYYETDSNDKALEILPDLLTDVRTNKDRFEKDMHYATLVLYTNILRDTKRFKERAPIAVERLAVATKLYGEEHKSTLDSMSALAVNEYRLKNHQNSLALLEKKLAIQTKLFPADDMRIKHTMLDIVAVTTDFKRWSDAKKVFDPLYSSKNLDGFERMEDLLDEGILIYNALDDKAKVKELEDKLKALKAKQKP